MNTDRKTMLAIEALDNYSITHKGWPTGMDRRDMRNLADELRTGRVILTTPLPVVCHADLCHYAPGHDGPHQSSYMNPKKSLAVPGGSE